MSGKEVPPVINLGEKLAKFDALWSPKIVAQMNDYYIKLVKIEDEFVWHRHPETDEVFLVIEGNLRIDFRKGAVELKQGEMVVVPRGAEHRPYAQRECQILLIEPVETVNTGDAGGDRTVVHPEWI
ncbi:MAG: cupin domain-containing protein [Anaerolineales bacterium]